MARTRGTTIITDVSVYVHLCLIYKVYMGVARTIGTNIITDVSVYVHLCLIYNSGDYHYYRCQCICAFVSDIQSLYGSGSD